MSSFIEGIDVSSNQGTIDWTSVVQGSISFCFARAALGARSVDSRFTANWRGVSNAGLIRDAYHVFWPSADSSQQADHFVSVVGALGPSDLARALDLEEVYPRGDRQHDIWTFIPAAQRLPMVRDWRNRVEQALGMRPLMYTRQNFIQTSLGEGIQALAGYPSLGVPLYGCAAAALSRDLEIMDLLAVLRPWPGGWGDRWRGSRQIQRHCR